MAVSKCPVVAHRAWNVLRLALLWARKGGIFKRRLATELGLLSKYLKCLGHTARTPKARIHYFERELSFDKTPIFHVKMHRPSSMRFHLPCMNPQVDFDYDFGDDDVEYDDARKSFLVAPQNDDAENAFETFSSEGEEEGIDKRAEEFIAKFYQQMKLQRQISLLQYNQTPTRDSLSI
ncbi:hypothetical protein L6164_034750 [Bauhinia variegata]|uniref:Uncharacterized protein n=1 Tax=Bauhinia variegata TaxID=167791 RepID=A0ACB9KW40_BAUVA|nr:hypothetical protein L6164_034750 [Bauhinia variegata]